jgi:proline iminopeptidase
MKPLYPEITPFNTFFLNTGTKHSVYVEQCGNPDGIAVIFLHGGPCSGCKPDHRRFFDPVIYHIILFDQRGCGRSMPYGELEHNTTQDLLADMEQIREQLLIEQWLVFGGSWGGALGLFYAQQHTRRVSALIIRAVFLARQQDLNWFVQDGAGRIYPELWKRLLDSVAGCGGDNLIGAICKILEGGDEVARRRVVRAWFNWGSQVSLGQEYKPSPKDEHVTAAMVKQLRMEMHYARNCYFFKENQIIEDCHRLQHIPAVIIHGRNDMVCPMEAGFRLHQALPHAEYVVLPNAGHVARGAEMIHALVSATDKMIGVIKS